MLERHVVISSCYVFFAKMGSLFLIWAWKLFGITVSHHLDHGWLNITSSSFILSQYFHSVHLGGVVCGLFVRKERSGNCHWEEDSGAWSGGPRVSSSSWHGSWTLEWGVLVRVLTTFNPRVPWQPAGSWVPVLRPSLAAPAAWGHGWEDREGLSWGTRLCSHMSSSLKGRGAGRGAHWQHGRQGQWLQCGRRRQQKEGLERTVLQNCIKK